MTSRTRAILRGLASALLAAHLLAVVAAPLAVQPTSPLFGGLFLLCRPYLEAANLNHGYHFFGPDPGPGTLIRYEVQLADGDRLDGVFPDRHQHWPRLMYHRHFMLTDKLPPAPAGSEHAIWKEAFARSYAQHLYHRHGASQVTLYLQNHMIPYPQQLLEGMALDHADLYEEQKLIDYQGESP